VLYVFKLLYILSYFIHCIKKSFLWNDFFYQKKYTVSGVTTKICDNGLASTLCSAGNSTTSVLSYGSVTCCGSANCNDGKTVIANGKFVAASIALSVLVGLFGTRF
jgi:hypothetical protein